MTIADCRSLILDVRGAVMAEGVIVLPVFVIILAAILFLHRSYATKLEQSVKARSCAWHYAVHGCTAEAMPASCPIVTIAEFESIDGALAGKTGALSAPTDLGEGLTAAGDLGGALIQAREGIVAHPQAAVKRPALFGGGEQTISGDYTVMCNERHVTPREIAMQAYCALGQSKLAGCE